MLIFSVSFGLRAAVWGLTPVSNPFLPVWGLTPVPGLLPVWGLELVWGLSPVWGPVSVLNPAEQLQLWRCLLDPAAPIRKLLLACS